MWRTLQSLLSHLIDIPLAKSENNATPWTLALRKGRHILETHNATYSYDDLYTAYSIPFQRLPLSDFKIQKVLILGFAMGSIVELLSLYFQLSALHIKAVEIDPELIQLYTKWKKNAIYVTLENEDAHTYMLQQIDTYDLICIDIFIDNVVPDIFDQDIFIQKVVDALSPGGLCIWNRLHKDATQSARNLSYYQHTFSQLFSRTEIMQQGDTYTMIGIK